MPYMVDALWDGTAAVSTASLAVCLKDDAWEDIQLAFQTNACPSGSFFIASHALTFEGKKGAYDQSNIHQKP